MTLDAAQAEVRAVFMNGAIGQAIAGLVWLASAFAAETTGTRAAILVLAAGGAFIFPLTQLVLRLLRRRTSLSADNPLNALAMQVAFTVPLALPLIGAAALYRLNWFYPAFMIVVGAHYLPFVFLYGMRAFGVLAIALLAGAYMLGFSGVGEFSLGGWATGTLLLVFATWAVHAFRQEHAQRPAAEPA